MINSMILYSKKKKRDKEIIQTEGERQREYKKRKKKNQPKR